MNPRGGKVSKACDPCRRRKTKCDGQRPCLNCQSVPSACSYRLKARVRPRKFPRPGRTRPPRLTENGTVRDRSSPSPGPGTIGSPPSHTPSRSRDVYSGVHDHDGVVATDFDRSHIFYGQSSSYAITQQIRRMILHPESVCSTGDDWSAKDIGVVLDMFMQRHLYFGAPLRADSFVSLQICARSGLRGIIPKSVSMRFLENFKTSTLHILPFFSSQTLDSLLDVMYDNAASANLSPQWHALLFVILATGALSGTETELAEALFLLAKQGNWLHEDAVTLETIQFSLLAADYQLNIGRPTSAYLYIGAACRKAFAMGLTVNQKSTRNAHKTEDEQRSTTLWCLYYFDRYGSQHAHICSLSLRC